MAEELVEIFTPAKINLGLQVVGERPDGFHSIKTVFQTVGLFDVLTVRINAKPGDELLIEGEDELSAGADNLVNRALKRLRSENFSIPPLSIELNKNIPTGAGLGGGSSDAAAVFHLARFLGKISKLRTEKNFEIAAALGADVPFFLTGGTALGEGIGEEITSLPEQKAEVLLAVPDYSIDTEWAYSRLGERGKSGSAASIGRLPDNITDANKLWKKWDLNNIFEPLLVKKYPRHGEILQSFSRFTEYFSTTGSGSGIYGLFEGEDRAQQARAELEESWPRVDWYLTSFVHSDSCPKIDNL